MSITSEFLAVSRILSGVLDNLPNVLCSQTKVEDESTVTIRRLLPPARCAEETNDSIVKDKESKCPLLGWITSLRSWNNDCVSETSPYISGLKFIRAGIPTSLTLEAISSLKIILTDENLQEVCEPRQLHASITKEILHELLLASYLLINSTARSVRSVSSSKEALLPPSAVSPLCSLSSIVARYNILRILIPKASDCQPSSSPDDNFTSSVLASLTLHSLLGCLIRSDMSTKCDFFFKPGILCNPTAGRVNKEESRYASIISLLCSDDHIITQDMAWTLVRMLHFTIAMVKVPVEKFLEVSAGGVGIVRCLVTLLVYSIRSAPDHDQWGELLSGIVVEIVRALYTLQCTSPSQSPSDDIFGADKETMTQLGVILCEILQFPNSNIRLYKVKLNVVQLFMHMPDGYSYYLCMNGGIHPLVDILKFQLLFATIEGASISSEWNNPAADENANHSLLPIIVVLNKMCQCNATVRSLVHERVFHAEEGSESKTNLVDSENLSELESYGTLRKMLIMLMTSFDTNVKRTSSELLWVLCNGDKDDFVKKTGFGNAVHLLSIKGLLAMPN